MRRLILASAPFVVAACSSSSEVTGASESHLAGAPRALVATLSGESATIEQVELTPFDEHPFENALVHLRELPTDVTPDASGCYCFPPTDDRFAYPHAYEHATRAVRDYDERLVEIGLPPVAGVGVAIRKAAPGVWTTGSTQDQPEHWSYVETSSPVVDTSILVHELGHVFDAHIRDQDGSVSPSSVHVPLAFGEVFANLFSMLYLRISSLGAYAWKDAALDMTLPLRSPDGLISERAFMQRAIDAPRFSAAFPATVEVLRDALADPAGRGRYDGPDSYSSSAIVVGPMLALAGVCGYEAAQRIALAALRGMPASAGVGDYAPRLVSQAATSCPSAAAALEASFRDSALLP